MALKIRSRDVIHKSDVGGVALNLTGAQAVEAAARAMNDKVAKAMPQAKLEGFIVQEMIHRASAYELIAGVTTDVTFGPVILFGHGGTAVEVLRDKSLELPPLNTALARAQIERTRIAKLLHGYRDRPAADIDGVVNVLVQLSRIVADQPQVTELDINPLLCDARGVIAVDGRVRINAVSGAAEARLAIRPYPKRFESTVRSRDGKTYAARPIRPEDEGALRAFADKVDNNDLWHPFFAPLAARRHETAARLSQIDYDREMALVAWDGDTIVGLARSVSDPDFDTAECAVIVRADRREQGLALALIDALTGAVAALGIRRAALVFPQDRARMVNLAKELGFAMAPDAADATETRAVKQLRKG